MKIKVKQEYAEAWAEKVEKEIKKPSVQLDKLRDKLSWSRRPDKEVDIISDHYSVKELDLLRDLLLEHKDDRTTNGALQNISLVKKVASNPTGTKIGKLETMVEVLKRYISDTSPNKWLIKQDNDRMMNPYLVVDIEYNPAERSSSYPAPANVRMKMQYFRDDDKGSTSVLWHLHEVQGKTVLEVLNEAGYTPANQEVIDEHKKSFERFADISEKVGEQYVTSGYGYPADDRYNNSFVRLVTDGDYHKMVSNHDPDKVLNIDGMTASGLFWGLDNTDVLHVPIHPYVRMFNLEEHRNYRVHASLLEEYEYNEGLIDKLILPQEHKDLIHMLGKSAHTVFEDIIEGKSGGSIILASGGPGTGKTLTAEVYSEYLKRPLYVVQCSQLGLDIETVEKRLKQVLRNASRWNAVLLIDEADVYIHERGSNMVQNAIVGVFLRLLERYKGVMFMTTNRANVVDDAIMSRVLASIVYESPTAEAVGKIFKIQAANFGFDVSDEDINEFKEKYGHLTGRSVKNLLKLTKFLCISKETEGYDIKLVDHAAKFAIVNDKDMKESVKVNG